jgi:hypothetical protein
MAVASIISGLGFLELGFLCTLLIYLPFWIFTLVNCISRHPTTLYPVFSNPDQTKVFWLIIVIGSFFLGCFGLVGLIIYWAMNSAARPSI